MRLVKVRIKLKESPYNKTRRLKFLKLKNY